MKPAVDLRNPRREGGAAAGLRRWGSVPVRALEARWRLPRLEVHRVLPSTSDRLKELTEEKAEAWTTVVAREQSAGRGRGGSGWHSPAELGLWMSVLLPRVEEGADRSGAPLSPILTGLAVARAVEDRAPELRVDVKWPNDLLVEGRKVCGILCESQGNGIVAGVGINVAQKPADFPPGIRERATSLEAEIDRTVAIPELCGSVLSRLRELWSRQPHRLQGVVARELEARDALRGRRIRTEAGEGRAVGIAADGALRIETEPGSEIRVVAGGVEFLDRTGGGLPGAGTDEGGDRSCSS